MPFWMGAQNLKLTRESDELSVMQNAANVIYGGPIISLVFALVIRHFLGNRSELEVQILAFAVIALPCAIMIPLGLYFHRQPPVITWNRLTRQLTLPRQGLTIDSAHVTLVLRIEHHDDPEGDGTYPVLVWLLHPTTGADDVVLYIAQRQKNLRATACEVASVTGIPLIDHTR